jgi:phosphate transport system substrate-binding protein
MRLTTHRRLAAFAVAITAVALAGACGSSKSTSGGSGGSLSAQLLGSGSTFQKNLQEASIAKFTQANTGVTINYRGGGSGQGKSDLANGVVDYAGTDSTLKDTEVTAFKGATVLFFPIAGGPVTVSYNLGIDNLQLSGPTLGKIFQAKITTWNDPAIAKDNPGVNLPSTKITVVHRNEASGTTSNFTKFLDKAAPGDWTLGHGDTVQWPPSTQGGQGNAGVATIVKDTSGAVGYVDYADAKAAGLKFAKVQNANGEFVAASTDAASKALEVATLADDLTFDPIDVKGAGVYPITAPTWIIVRAQQTNKAKGDAVKAYIKYILDNNDSLTSQTNYAPLPSSMKDKALAQLDKLQIPTS